MQLKMSFGALIVAGVVLATGARAPAQNTQGFRSPSGNIHCQFFDGEGGKAADAVVRCDIISANFAPPPRPRDCDMEWGQAFEISGAAAAGYLLCHGDTVRDNTMPVLPYGRTMQRAGLTCVSEQTGVTCVNAKGRGFEVARGKMRLF